MGSVVVFYPSYTLSLALFWWFLVNFCHCAFLVDVLLLSLVTLYLWFIHLFTHVFCLVFLPYFGDFYVQFMLICISCFASLFVGHCDVAYDTEFYLYFPNIEPDSMFFTSVMEADTSSRQPGFSLRPDSETQRSEPPNHPAGRKG